MIFTKMAKILVLATALALAGSSAFAVTAAEGAANLIKVGSDPILFNLKDIKGNDMVLQDQLGKKAILLVFWSLFCGPCQEELPLVDKLGKKYKEQGFNVWTVNLDGPQRGKAVDKFLTKNGYAFDVLWEKIEGTSYITADAYGIAGTPSVVMVGKNGKVTYAHVGNATEQDLEAAINEAIK